MTRLRCFGKCYINNVANVLLSSEVKEFLNRPTLVKVMNECEVACFLAHSVFYSRATTMNFRSQSNAKVRPTRLQEVSNDKRNLKLHGQNHNMSTIRLYMLLLLLLLSSSSSSSSSSLLVIDKKSFSASLELLTHVGRRVSTVVCPSTVNIHTRP